MNIVKMKGQFKKLIGESDKIIFCPINEQRPLDNMLVYQNFILSKSDNDASLLIKVITHELISGVNIQIIFDDCTNINITHMKSFSDYIEECKSGTFAYTFESKNWLGIFNKICLASYDNEEVRFIITSYRNDAELL